MLRDENVLEFLLEDSRLPELIEELNVRWKNEQQLREEFYKKIQPGDKWEFINGKIVKHLPFKDKETKARMALNLLLQTYVSMHDGGTIRDVTALVALTRNDYLPDIVYFSREKSADFTPDTWQYPIPDFVVEILSKGTEKTVRGIKKEDYASHGAKEYWIVDPDLQTVEHFVLDEAKREFELFAKKTSEDHITCQIISGCSFPVAAIFDEKMKMQVVRDWLK
jgi:Uma2 family endonuclease